MAKGVDTYSFRPDLRSEKMRKNYLGNITTLITIDLCRKIISRKTN